MATTTFCADITGPGGSNVVACTCAAAVPGSPRVPGPVAIVFVGDMIGAAVLPANGERMQPECTQTHLP